MDTSESFVRNFESWMETHHEVVSFITGALISSEDSEVKRIEYFGGTRDLYTLGKQWTDEFEKLHRDTDWDVIDFWEAIEQFCKQKNKV